MIVFDILKLLSHFGLVRPPKAVLTVDDLKRKRPKKSKKKSKGSKTGNVTMAMAQDGYASKCDSDGSQKSIEAFNRPEVSLKSVNQNTRFKSTEFRNKMPQRGLPDRRLVGKKKKTSSFGPVSISARVSDNSVRMTSIEIR